MLMRRLVLVAAVGALCVGALPSASAMTPESPNVVLSSVRATIKASAVLKALRVRAEVTSGYSRDYFHHWIDADRDGCDTRKEVLLAEARTSPSRYGSCSLSGGSWWSAYDGVITSDSSTFDVDHFVALAEAWGSGAWRWSYSTREAFANDLGFAGSLIAVSASSNRSKSDRDPAHWLPPNSNYWCTYATTWIAVKYRWSLTIDRAEKLKLRSLVVNCGNPRISLPPKATVINDQSDPGGAGGGSGGGTGGGGGLDPKFSYCYEAQARGYGPYIRGIDPEYAWYRDGDNDGMVCE
jgi:hypothetical protein